MYHSRHSRFASRSNTTPLMGEQKRPKISRNDLMNLLKEEEKRRSSEEFLTTCDQLIMSGNKKGYLKAIETLQKEVAESLSYTGVMNTIAVEAMRMAAIDFPNDAAIQTLSHHIKSTQSTTTTTTTSKHSHKPSNLNSHLPNINIFDIQLDQIALRTLTTNNKNGYKWTILIAATPEVCQNIVNFKEIQLKYPQIVFKIICIVENDAEKTCWNGVLGMELPAGSCQKSMEQKVEMARQLCEVMDWTGVDVYVDGIGDKFVHRLGAWSMRYWVLHGNEIVFVRKREHLGSDLEELVEFLANNVEKP